MITLNLLINALINKFKKYPNNISNFKVKQDSKTEAYLSLIKYYLSMGLP